MKPVFGYLRVSGLGQIDGDGFDRQKEAILRFCEFKGYSVLRWFTEKAVSGDVDAFDRPQFCEMLALCGDATTDTVVVERADRLARDLMVSELAIEEARKCEVTIWDACASTNMTDSSDPTRVAIRQMLGVMAQWNKNLTVLRLRSARQRKRSRGERCEGKIAFEKKSQFFETSALIWSLRNCAGYSYPRIKKELERRKIKPPGGRQFWNVSTIYEMTQRRQELVQKEKNAASPVKVTLVGLDIC